VLPLTEGDARGKVAVTRRKWLLLLALAPALLAGVYAGRGIWLRQIGEFLVRAEAPEPADICVVLAGDAFGHRIMKAVELARQGYVRQVLVDGPRGMYGFDEAELAIRFAVSQGAARELFIPLAMKARSTVEEAGVVDAELRRRNARKALIVTSNYHTRRAGAIFRRYGSPHIRYVIVAAPDEDFEPAGWWRSRHAEKVVFFEYAKLVDWWLRG
jgi:uncharacterized SAM-binding protein YcdF (DUF218 family)